MSIDIDKLIKHMEENPMTPEQIERDIICLNGIMTQELFDKVMNELSQQCSLNSESLQYDKSSNITYQEFIDVFHYLDKVAGDEKYESYNHFPNTQAYFIYNGKKFIWDLLIGQGSSCSLYVYGYNDEEWHDEYKIVIKEIDENVRFYKKV